MAAIDPSHSKFQRTAKPGYRSGVLLRAPRTGRSGGQDNPRVPSHHRIAATLEVLTQTFSSAFEVLEYSARANRLAQAIRGKT